MSIPQKTIRERTCISCGQKASKESLYRIVRNKEGNTSCDVSGKRAGRGAYVCSRECLEDALRSKKLERALRARIASQECERIADGFEAAIREQ